MSSISAKEHKCQRSFYNFSFFQLDAHHMSSPLFLLNVTLALEEKKPDHVVASWSGPSSRSSQINVLHVMTIRGCSYITLSYITWVSPIYYNITWGGGSAETPKLYYIIYEQSLRETCLKYYLVWGDHLAFQPGLCGLSSQINAWHVMMQCGAVRRVPTSNNDLPLRMKSSRKRRWNISDPIWFRIWSVY